MIFLALVLAVLLMPVWLPLLSRSMVRDERRKRKLVETWPCGWCVAPLGEAALSRADALEAAESKAEQIGDDWMDAPVHSRRILGACCPRCGAGHYFARKQGAFLLLNPREVGARFGALMEEAVPAPTCRMAWPWLRPAGPMHMLQVTRDPIAAFDTPEHPPSGTIEVPADVDVAAIAEALLRSPWLPDPGPSARWRCMTGAVALEFGKEAGIPFVQRAGDIPLRVDTVPLVHLVYAYDRNDHNQQDGTH
jgi:hypothetical protein